MIRQVNEELAKIYARVNANKLSSSVEKINFMLFMPKYLSHYADHSVMKQTRIQEVKETKFLGLSWTTRSSGLHISSTSAKKLPMVLVSYWSQENVFSNETLSSLYHIFSYPYLSYCIHVWGNAGIQYPSQWSYNTTEQSYADNQWCTTKNKYGQVLYRKDYSDCKTYLQL